MTRILFLLAAGAAGLAAAVPGAAQTPYQYPPQDYPTYPQQTYPQPGYGAPQGQNVIGQMIGQLLGNRYAASDRYAVERCATAAVAQANAQFPDNRYGRAYGYQDRRDDDDDRNDQYRDDRDERYDNPNRGYNRARMMRVTAITEVQRRQGGLRVSGLLDSRGGYRPYGQQPYGNAYGYQGQGYQGQGYAAQGDLSFRCNVDYRGTVTNVRVRRNQAAYRGY
jgi:hypothetical protein